MPVQTRAKAPSDRIYSSPAAQQQLRFRPRKQNVTYRRTLDASHRSRQQTLTQIDFVSPQDIFDQDDRDRYINYETEQSKRRKRRRTDGDIPSSSSNFHTQTLTQLEFVSTPTSRFEDAADVENNFNNDSIDLKDEPDTSPAHKMGPPKTPSRRRVYEVPSSQSPYSPISVRSQRYSTTRSPLNTLDNNLQRQSLSPVLYRELAESPTLNIKIEDKLEFGIESQQSRVSQTPSYVSSSTKSASSPVQSRMQNGTRKLFKDEIRDSDEEDDNDLESCYDDKLQESQLDPYCKLELSPQLAASVAPNLSRSDTQEAENQLQSTILQFTQHFPSTAVAAVDKKEQNNTPYIRPSQATTVSQSQPATSSPTFLRRPNEQLPLRKETLTNDQGGGQDQEWNDIEEGLPTMMTVPDSPSQCLASDSSWLSPRIQRTRNRQHHQISLNAQNHQQQQNHVPTSTSYTSSSPPIKITRPQWTVQSSAPKNPESDPNQSLNTSPVQLPFSLLPSSQILTRSQMLPDSLMNASVPHPPSLPFFIEDSETESDFEE